MVVEQQGSTVRHLKPLGVFAAILLVGSKRSPSVGKSMYYRKVISVLNITARDSKVCEVLEKIITLLRLNKQSTSHSLDCKLFIEL